MPEDLDNSIGDGKICKVTDSTNASGQRRHGEYNTNAQEKELRALLSRADNIESLEHFTYWKSEFLTEYKAYCDPEGTGTAREVEEDLYDEMEHLAKLSLKVKELCKSGAITEVRSTVKGQNALNELVAMMAKTETHIRDFMPKTNDDESKAGYTKYELAAILIRDGFRIYGIMISTRDYILSLSQAPNGPLSKGNILTPNSKSIMDFYMKSIHSLCDTFADMGLWNLMQKCEELFSVRPRKKKKKNYLKSEGKDALSDTSNEEVTPTKGRMFQKPKKKYNKAIIDNGWTSGVTGTSTLPRPGTKKPDGTLWTDEEIEYLKKNPAALSKDGRIDPHAKPDEEDEKDIQYIYYYDPVTETVGKIPRTACSQLKTVVWKEEGEKKETHEGKEEKWDGPDGIKNIIWTFKEHLKPKKPQPSPKVKKTKKKQVRQ